MGLMSTVHVAMIGYGFTKKYKMEENRSTSHGREEKQVEASDTLSHCNSFPLVKHT